MSLIASGKRGPAFRYLVMERMGGPITDVSRLLLQSHSKSISAKKAQVAVGEVAAAMLTCLQSVHDAGMVYVDVKPDNFMLARAPPSGAGAGGGDRRRRSRPACASSTSASRSGTAT